MDRSLDDPCPEARVSPHHYGNINSSDVEEYPHSNLAGTSDKNRVCRSRGFVFLPFFCFSAHQESDAKM